MCSSRQRTFERCSSSDNWDTLRRGKGEDGRGRERREGGEVTQKLCGGHVMSCDVM